MTANDNDTFMQVIRKLDRLAQLNQADRDAIRSLTIRTTTVKANRLLVREGAVVTNCCILLTGYACRSKSVASGERQIVSFHIPGDILDAQHLFLSRADHDVQTITEVTVAWVPAAEIKQLVRERQAIAEALWRDTLIDASIFREWVVNVGRRDARQRIAHMLCEFAVRREAAGLGSVEKFELPMTQQDIADATGLTSVHVNRSLRTLDEADLIQRRGRQVTITNWQAMQKLAGFDPKYLHVAA